jgi:hypothetical protein
MNASNKKTEFVITSVTKQFYFVAFVLMVGTHIQKAVMLCFEDFDQPGCIKQLLFLVNDQKGSDLRIPDEKF